tara:strand:+ start:1148 stop:2671 length:1524 start_codon:yes stop_codon:yes gene_type:complete
MLYTTASKVTYLTYLWSDLNYTSSAIIAVSFFFFAAYFGSEYAKVHALFKLFTAVFLVVVIVFIQIPIPELSVIESLTIEDGNKVENFGLGYFFYLTLLVGYLVGGITILLIKLFKGAGAVRDQLKFIILGTGFAIVTGITTNIVFANIGLYGFEWLGPVGTLIMVIFISYAITKHRLWDFKLIIVELFVALMIIILLLQIFIATTLIEQIIRVFIFAAVSSLSFFLVRNLLREVDAREILETLAKNLSKANNRLRVIDIEKSDFVSITSHQFRTPLTVIKGYSSMLLEGSLGTFSDKRQKTAVDKIFRASQRLVITIEEFLNISRIEQSQMNYEYSKVNLREIVAQVISESKQSIKDVGLEITFNAKMAEEFLIRGDRKKLEMVFSNIIENSIKYTPAGGKILVELSKKKDTKSIILEVSDTGIGIPKEMQVRLFEKFSRATGISKLHTEGRGLGLYVAKQIIRAHGGRIWAISSGKDKGSTFFLEFPDWEYEQQRKEIKEFVEGL